MSGKSLYAVSILRNIQAEREAMADPETRVLDAEPQQPHLAFCLNSKMHDKLMEKYPNEVEQRDKKFLIKTKNRNVNKEEMKPAYKE